MKQKIIKSELEVNDNKFKVITIDNKEFISLIDLASYANPEEPKIPIQTWMRNKDVIVYLGLWEQFKNAPETLSSIEIFVFNLIDSREEKQQGSEKNTDELEYDQLNRILCATDKEVRETLESLFLGELIHEVLELPAMKDIKSRQKENGLIANIDKPFIIDKIRGIVLLQDYMSRFKQVIDNRYIEVKMGLLLGEGEEVFEQYLQYNTNISSYEVFGVKKDNIAQDVCNYFMDMMNNRNEQVKQPKK